MGMVTVRDPPSIGRAWGFPSASLYWIEKESNSPCAMVQERWMESWVTLEAESSPRVGWTWGSSSCGAGAATEKQGAG